MRTIMTETVFLQIVFKFVILLSIYSNRKMNVDNYIGMLERLEIIPEKDVKQICEKVSFSLYRLKKY